MSKGPQFPGKEAEATSPTLDWGRDRVGLVGISVEIREKEAFTQVTLLLCHKTVIETVKPEWPQCR